MHNTRVRDKVMANISHAVDALIMAFLLCSGYLAQSLAGLYGFLKYLGIDIFSCGKLHHIVFLSCEPVKPGIPMWETVTLVSMVIAHMTLQDWSIFSHSVQYSRAS